MRPIIEAMVVCDAVHRDPGTGKHYLLGTFGATFAKEFPAQAQPFTLFIVASGMRSPTTVQMRMVRGAIEEETVVIPPQDLPLAVNHALGSVECTVELEGVVYEVEGDHRLQLLWDSELLSEKTIAVRRAPR